MSDISAEYPHHQRHEALATGSDCPRPVVGAGLRKFLGITAEVTPVSHQYQFEHAIYDRLHREKVETPELLIDLIAELVSMNLPLFALKLQILNKDIWPATDFNAVFLLAAAYMQAGNLVEAKKEFFYAHNLGPTEVAVHFNMATILREELHDAAAREWLQAGLCIDRNAAQLWHLAAQLYAATEVLGLARKYSSWLGASLWLQMSDEIVSTLKIYRQVFAGGERSSEFLIEYTGILGREHKYAELSNVAWQIIDGAPLAWQVYVHLAQGFQHLQKEKQFQLCVNRACRDPQIPADVALALKKEKVLTS